jgi:hypothetical protein
MGKVYLRRRQMRESLPLELEVLNPRGELRIETEGLSNPRVTDLAGKKILLIPNRRVGSDFFIAALEKVLKEKYPAAATILLGSQPFDFQTTPADNEEREATNRKIREEVDAWIYGVGT